MVCDEGVGLIMVIKRAKILKIKGCAAFFFEFVGVFCGVFKGRGVSVFEGRKV